MTTETLPCASPDCDGDVSLDEDYVRVEGHVLHTDDRDEQDDYYVHVDCWSHLTSDWTQP